MSVVSKYGIVIPPALKVIGGAVLAVSAFYAPGPVKLGIIVGGTIVAVGMLWSKLVKA